MNDLALPDNGWVVAQENLKRWCDENFCAAYEKLIKIMGRGDMITTEDVYII